VFGKKKQKNHNGFFDAETPIFGGNRSIFVRKPRFFGRKSRRDGDSAPFSRNFGAEGAHFGRQARFSKHGARMRAALRLFLPLGRDLRAKKGRTREKWTEKRREWVRFGYIYRFFDVWGFIFHAKLLIFGKKKKKKKKCTWRQNLKKKKLTITVNAV
jgi:hypothetical protein